MTHTATAEQAIRRGTVQRAPSFATLLVLLTGSFVVTLDFFVVNVAIPAVQQELHAGPAAIQWIVAGFGLALAAGLITGGRLGDLYGPRRLYALGLGLFTAASLGCGLAPTAQTLIAARVVQGGAAALLMPQVLGIVNQLFSGADRARAFTAYGLSLGFGGVFGQLIGGALIQADLFGSGWRAIFLINVPVGVVALLVLPRVVPDVPARRDGARLDPLGATLVTLALVATVLPLIEGQRLGWPAWTWASLAAAAALTVAFVLTQKAIAAHGGAPLVDLALFRDRSFAVGSTLMLVYMLAMSSFFLYLALYLQSGRGMSALDSGLLFTTLGGGYFLASLLATRVVTRLGRHALTVGALVQAGGCALLLDAVSRGAALGWLAPGLVLAGVGMGLVVAPVASIVLSNVRPERAGAAAGVLSTAQQVGGALGVAVVGIAFYDALGGTADVASAFRAALVAIVAAAAATGALAQLLGRPHR